MNAHTPRTLGTGEIPSPMADNGEAGFIARGAGKWGDRHFPKTGWEFVWDEDCGEPDFVCEMCEYKIIRHIQHLIHPSGRELATGCICAGHLTGDLDAAKARDRKMKNDAVRFRNRRKAHDRDWDSFRKIDICGPSVLKALHGIKVRALKLARKAAAESDISLNHFELELDAHCLVYEAEKAADEAQRVIQEIEQFLANPEWRDITKVVRVELPDRVGSIEVVLDNNQYKVGIKCFGEQRIDWMLDGFSSEEDAKQKGIDVLRSKLCGAGS